MGKAVEVYQYLEPLYNDYRKVRKQLADGNYALGHVDDVIDEMLQSDYMFDIALPRLQSRFVVISRMFPRTCLVESSGIA